MPVALRKSGIPDSVLHPAPVKATMLSLESTSFFRALISSVISYLQNERMIYMGVCKCCNHRKYNTYYKYLPVCLACFRRVLRAEKHFA